MSGKRSKEIRRKAQQYVDRAVRRRDVEIVPEFKSFVNKLSFLERIKVSWRVIIGRL